MCVGHKKNFGAVYKVEEEEGKKKDWAAPRPRITILLKENRKKNILVKKKRKENKAKIGRNTRRGWDLSSGIRMLNRSSTWRKGNMLLFNLIWHSPNCRSNSKHKEIWDLIINDAPRGRQVVLFVCTTITTQHRANEERCGTRKITKVRRLVRLISETNGFDPTHRLLIEFVAAGLAQE